MARKEADLTACMITQDFLPEHWALTDPQKAIIMSKDVKQIAKLLCDLLENNGIDVTECYAIRHDKDQHTVWDEINKQYVVTFKSDHGHYLFKFNKGNSTLTAIAKAVGLEPQFVEKPQKGRFAYDNMLAYLIHIKYVDKHQYYNSQTSTTSVVTIKGESYDKIYHERMLDWKKGRAKVQSQKAKADIDWLESQILQGEITRAQVFLTDEYYNIYAHNVTRCNNAFDTYGEWKIQHTIQKMNSGEFKLSVIFVTGKSHSGKSMFTDNLVKAIQTKAEELLHEQWTVCSVAASNPFDEYRGEDILVMDDLRGVALSASDWLKLLDPDRVSMGSARYRNKQIACRTIIINSEKDVLDFFYYLKNGGGDRSEAMDQFFRRISAKVIVHRIEDTNIRRVAIGKLLETKQYDCPHIQVKDGKTYTQTLKLHHDFSGVNTPEVDAAGFMDYESGIEYLTDDIMSRNTDVVQPPQEDNSLNKPMPWKMGYNQATKRKRQPIEYDNIADYARIVTTDDGKDHTVYSLDDCYYDEDSGLYYPKDEFFYDSINKVYIPTYADEELRENLIYNTYVLPQVEVYEEEESTKAAEEIVRLFDHEFSKENYELHHALRVLQDPNAGFATHEFYKPYFELYKDMCNHFVKLLKPCLESLIGFDYSTRVTYFKESSYFDDYKHLWDTYISHLVYIMNIDKQPRPFVGDDDEFLLYPQDILDRRKNLEEADYQRVIAEETKLLNKLERDENEWVKIACQD